MANIKLKLGKLRLKASGINPVHMPLCILICAVTGVAALIVIALIG
jgi:hypothetical protein